MLKYIKGHMATIDGVGIYPIISLLIFFTFFVVLIIYVLRYDKERIIELENQPLSDNNTDYEN